MRIDRKRILTIATCKQAHAGQMGWFGDDLSDLLNAMWKKPVELKEISYAPFSDGSARYKYFCPSEEPSCEASCEERQEDKEMSRHNTGAVDENGLLPCPVKYRPFDEAGLNLLVGKVIVKKSTGKRSVITQAFNNAVGSWGFDIDARDLLEYYTFDDGTPCGVREE